MLMIHDNTATTVMRTDMAGYQQASVTFPHLIPEDMIDLSLGVSRAVIRR